MLKRKSKRILSIVLAVAMIVGLFPVAAFAEDGETSTVDTSLPPADTNGVITLTKDVTLAAPFTVAQNKNVTIDLNGKKIDAGTNQILLASGSELIIKDSSNGTGEISASGQTAAGTGLFLVDNATLTLNGGKFNAADNNYGVYASNGGKVIVNDGTFIAGYAPLAGNNTTGDMKFEVNGGTLTAKYGPAIYMPGQVNLTITNGTLNGGISLRMGQVNISGGTINAPTTNIDAVKDYYNYSGNAWLADALYVFNGTYTSENKEYGNSLDLNITGGTFNCTNNQGSAIAIYDLGKVAQSSDVSISGSAALHSIAKGRSVYQVLSLQDIGVNSPAEGFDNSEYVGKVQSSITGGTFSSDVSTYVPNGYICKQNAGNENWTVSNISSGQMVVKPESSAEGNVEATLDGVYNDASTDIKDDVNSSESNEDSNIDENGVVVNIAQNDASPTTSATLNVTKTAANTLASAPALTVKTDVGDVQLDAQALDKVAQATDDVAITIEKKTTGDSSVKALYTVEVKSGDKNLLPESATDNGTVTITVEEPDNVEDLQAWYVVGETDKLVYVEKLKTADAEDGKIAIKINHLSMIALTNGTPDAQEAAVVTNSNGTVTGRYATLNDAIKNVPNGGTITIQRDIPNATGISVESEKNFTLDFAGHTYTLTGPGAGSSGTETNGFQLLKDSTIVFKNGTIKIAEGANKIKRIIQSYANVTFENMNFYAKNQVDGENYALSFNYGNVVFKGDSNIYVTDPSDTIAFDVYRWTPDYDNISVTFDENYSGTVQGTILYDSDDGTKGKLNIKGNGGTFTKIDISAGSDDAAATGISVSGGKYANPLEPEWLEGLNAELYSQQNDLYSYFTNVDAALAAAQPGDKVVDLSATSTTTNYTVTIKYNNGDEDLTLTVPKNTELTLPAAPSREDYKFDGWIINGERYVTGAKVTITANTIISADWQPPYTGKYSYEIFTTVGDNGTIDVDRYATEGDKVTITVSPDEAYMLDEMTVTSGGKDVEVTDNGDGTYTFTMPSGDVKIEVTFAEDPNWEEEPAMPFTDVNEGDWFYDVVLYAYDNGLMTGVSATEFAPNQTTTRGMIVSMLARLEGVTSAEDAGFADVAENDWYATAVNWAASVGVVNGYEDNTFRPNAPITREQMAAILYNYADYKGYDVSARADLSDYADAASISSWAEDVLAWANAEGLINGMTATTIDPQGATTRAQTAAMFERFLTAHAE